MRRTALALIAAAVWGAAPAPAGERAPPETRIARELLSDSLKLMRANEVDMAVGYATAALDIASASGQEEISRQIETLLYAYRTISLGQIVEAARDMGEMEAASRVSVLVCRMAVRAPEDVAQIVAGARERYCYGEI